MQQHSSPPGGRSLPPPMPRSKAGGSGAAGSLLGRAVGRRQQGNGPHRCSRCGGYVRRYGRFMLCLHTLCRDCALLALRRTARCPACPPHAVPLFVEHVDDALGALMMTEKGRAFLSHSEMLRIREVEVAAHQAPLPPLPPLAPAARLDPAPEPRRSMSVAPATAAPLADPRQPVAYPAEPAGPVWRQPAMHPVDEPPVWGTQSDIRRPASMDPRRSAYDYPR